MRRIFAFLVDYMILLAVGFALVTLDTSGFTVKEFRIAVPALALVVLGYFFIADYKFKGMTPGKWILRLHLTWDQGEGSSRLAKSILHTLFKWLLVIIWPLTLILYICLGGRLPYDKRLGLSYMSGPRAPLWKTILRAAAGAVVFCAMVYSVVFLVLSQISKQEYYAVREEKIPSVYMVLGEQRLTGYSSSDKSGHFEAQYQYMAKGDGDELLARYMEYLIENEGFLIKVEAAYQGNVRVLARESGDGTRTTILLASSRDVLTVRLLCEQSGN